MATSGRGKGGAPGKVNLSLPGGGVCALFTVLISVTICRCAGVVPPIAGEVVPVLARLVVCIVLLTACRVGLRGLEWTFSLLDLFGPAVNAALSELGEGSESSVVQGLAPTGEAGGGDGAATTPPSGDARRCNRLRALMSQQVAGADVAASLSYCSRTKEQYVKWGSNTLSACGPHMRSDPLKRNEARSAETSRATPHVASK